VLAMVAIVRMANIKLMAITKNDLYLERKSRTGAIILFLNINMSARTSPIMQRNNGQIEVKALERIVPSKTLLTSTQAAGRSREKVRREKKTIAK
jgi:hypothetical protein